MSDTGRGELGTHAKCRITDIEGVIVSRIEHLYRSAEVAIARVGVNHDGLPWDLLWIDEDRIA